MVSKLINLFFGQTYYGLWYIFAGKAKKKLWEDDQKEEKVTERDRTSAKGVQAIGKRRWRMMLK